MNEPGKSKPAPRRLWDVEPWPWPEDSREDKPKRVALSYRQLVQDIAQARCDDPAGDLHRLDQSWLRRGAFWAVPSYDPYDGEEWVHAADAAHYADVEPGTIRKWAERELIRVDHDPDGAPIYNIADLRTLDAGRKQARIEAAQRRSRNSSQLHRNSPQLTARIRDASC